MEKLLELTRIGEHYMEGGLYQDEKGRYYVDGHHEPEDDGVSSVYILSPSDDPDGEPNYMVTCHIRILNPLTEKERREKNFRLEYMVLSRLNNDISAYFGKYGNEKKDKWDCRYRNASYLFGGNVKEHVAKMKQLWNKFPEDLKPEWCTWEQIISYENRAND